MGASVWEYDIYVHWARLLKRKSSEKDEHLLYEVKHQDLRI